MGVLSGEILFSLPSISNDIAAVEDATSLETVLVVHEDDWRQRELVHKGFQSKIDIEREAIRRVYESRSESGAFPSCHIRKEIPAPLDGANLALGDLLRVFGVKHRYSGVAFSAAAATIVQGFAFRSEGDLDIWGQQNESGIATTVCFQGGLHTGASADVRASIDRLLQQHNLLFVDWNPLDR
jgi:hypothetical protein